MSILLALALLFSTPINVVEPVGTYVGQLQEKWQFPSDHLPIGLSWDKCHIVSWNVLDSEHINWVIEKDSQGLKHSLIGEEHIYIEGSKLTLRDEHVTRLIIEMLKHPTHPKSLVALQECNAAFISQLSEKLPLQFALVASDEYALIYDKTKFQIIDNQYHSDIFSDEPQRFVQVVVLQAGHQKLKIINAHLPGNPLKPARFEFAKFLAKSLDETMPTLALGDMNFNECEMRGALFLSFGEKAPFEHFVPPYCTNISPFKFHSKIIDHFFLYAIKDVKVNQPDEVLIGLQATASLLSPEAN